MAAARATLLSVGAAGGLLVLAWNTSMLLATLLGSILGWAWLMDWCKGVFCSSNARLDGKIAVVTGANTGIGKETARGLAARGARVVLACRDVAKAELAKLEIQKETSAEVDVMELDLASFESVRRFAKELAKKFAKLDILVNNAGIAFHPKEITTDGNERTMQVNHFSHFLLTNLLLDLLKAAGKARVINVSSLVHTWAKQGIQWEDLKWENRSFDSWQAYGQSKLANVLFTRELARRQSRDGIAVFAVHPGAVATELGRVYLAKIPAFLSNYVTDFINIFLKTSEGGAQTSIYCAVEPSLETESGKYYSECARTAPATFALDDKQAKKLWEVSLKIVGDVSPLKPTGKPIIETIGLISTTNSDLLSDIKSGAPSLTPVKAAEARSGSDLMKQEMMVKDVENFDRSELKKTDTQEPLTGAEMLKKELETKSLIEEVSKFDKAEHLKETEVLEKNILPDERQIRVEREKVELIGGIENFDVDNLNRVTMKEPFSGAELLQQELTHKAVQEEIGSFDQEGLRSTEVKDSVWLPGKEDIEEEREKVDHLAGIETFDTASMNKVKTPEPLSGAELLKRELTLKAVNEELGSFDVGMMKPTAVEEKNILPDQTILAEEKTRESLLKGVEDFSHEDLAHVKTPEPLSGADLVRQELGIKSIVDSVSTFDSNSLRSATTEEKIVLPDAETIQSEKDRVNLLKDLESEHNLSHVVAPEPLGGAALLKQELTRQQVMEGVETFNVDGLKHSEVQEKIVLPDMDTIQHEKTHVQHLEGIESFVQSTLLPVKISEPLSGPEVSKLEIQREGISSELASFDKTVLKETQVSEKLVLPELDDIQAERLHMDHLKGLEEGKELKKTETREPTNPLDLARLELHKDQVEEELQGFDRARLTPVVTEEKNFLPTKEQIQEESMGELMDEALSVSKGGAGALRNLLTDDGEREQRSSSEEWEKVDSEC